MLAYYTRYSRHHRHNIYIHIHVRWPVYICLYMRQRGLLQTEWLYYNLYIFYRRRL